MWNVDGSGGRLEGVNFRFRVGDGFEGCGASPGTSSSSEEDG